MSVESGASQEQPSTPQTDLQPVSLNTGELGAVLDPLTPPAQPATATAEAGSPTPQAEQTQTPETPLPPITQRDIARVIGAIQWTPEEQNALNLGLQPEMASFQQQIATVTASETDRAAAVGQVAALMSATTSNGAEFRHLTRIRNADVRRKILDALTQYIQVVGTETPARAETRPTADQRFLRSITGEQLAHILENAQFDNGTHGAFDSLNIGTTQTELQRELAELATAINEAETRQEAAELIQAYFSEQETFAGFDQTVQDAMRDALINHVENGRESGLRGLLSRVKDAFSVNNAKEALRKGTEKVQNWWNKRPSWMKRNTGTPPEAPDAAAPAAATAQEAQEPEQPSPPQETDPTYPEYPRTHAADRVYDYLEDFIAGPLQTAWNAIPEQQLRDFAEEVGQTFQSGYDQQTMEGFIRNRLEDADSTGAYVLFPTIGSTEVRQNLQNEVIDALWSFDPFSRREVREFLLEGMFEHEVLEDMVSDLPADAQEALVIGVVEVFDNLDQGERSNSRMRTPIRYVRDNVALRRNLAPVLAAVPMDEYMKTLLRAEIIEYYNRKVGQRNEAVRAAETPHSITDTLGSLKNEYAEKGSAQLARLNAKKAEVAKNLDQRFSTATRAARTKQVDSLSQKVGGEYAALSPEDQAASVTPETVREIRGQLMNIMNAGQSRERNSLAEQANRFLLDVQEYQQDKKTVPPYIYRQLVIALNSLGLYITEQGAVVEKDALSDEEAQEIVVEISRSLAEWDLSRLDKLQEIKLNPRAQERATKIKKWVARAAGFSTQAATLALPEGSPLKMGLSSLYYFVPVTLILEGVGYKFKYKSDGSRREVIAKAMDTYDGGSNASEKKRSTSPHAYWTNFLWGVVMGKATTVITNSIAESGVVGAVSGMVDNMMDWDADLSNNVADGVDGAGVGADTDLAAGAAPGAEVPAADTPTYHDAINDGVKEITGGADRSFAEYKNTQLKHDLDQYTNVDNLKMDHAQEIVSPLIGVDELTTPPENLEQYLDGVGDVLGVDMATVSTEDLANAIDDRFGGSTIQTNDVGRLFPTGMTDEEMQAYVDSNDGMSMDNGYITLTPEGLASLLDELREDVGMGPDASMTTPEPTAAPAEPTVPDEPLAEDSTGAVEDATGATGEEPTDDAVGAITTDKAGADGAETAGESGATPKAGEGTEITDLDSADLLQSVSEFDPSQYECKEGGYGYDHPWGQVRAEAWDNPSSSLHDNPLVYDANYPIEGKEGVPIGQAIDPAKDSIRGVNVYAGTVDVPTKGSPVVELKGVTSVADLDQLVQKFDGQNISFVFDPDQTQNLAEFSVEALLTPEADRTPEQQFFADMNGHPHFGGDANPYLAEHFTRDDADLVIRVANGEFETGTPVEVPPPEKIGPDQATTDAVAQMTGDTQPETLNERVSREAANNRAAAAANSGEVTGTPITDMSSEDLLSPTNDPVNTTQNPTGNGRDAGGSATILEQNPVIREDETFRQLGPNAKWDDNGVLIDPDIDGQEGAAAEPPAEAPAPEMIAPEVAIDAGLDERGYSGAAKEGLKYYMTEIMGESTVEEKFNTLFSGPNYGEHLAEMIDYVVDEDELTRSISDKILLNLADGKLEELTISGSIGETELFNGKMSVEAQKALLVELVSKAGEGYDGIAGQVSRLATGLPGESVPNFGYDANSVWGAEGIKMDAITDEFAKLASSGGEYSAEGVSERAVKEVFEDIPANLKDNPAAATPAQQAYYIMRLFGKFSI